MEDLMREWLWMEAMNYALEHLKWSAKHAVFPPDKEDEWKHLDWKEMQKLVFTFVLESWPSASICGKASGHTQYSVGYDIDMNGQRIRAEYKHMSVEIRWLEVRRFIEKMLSEDVTDRQISLLDLLAETAQGGM